MEYVRVSASYLFNIQLDDYYLLIKSERRNQRELKTTLYNENISDWRSSSVG